MRRRRGTGTVELAPDGRYVPRLPGRRGKRLEPCDTREEAERDLDAALAIIRDRLVHPEGITLADFAEGFLQRREQTHANARDDRSTWNACVADADFADRPLVSLSPVAIRAWRDALLSRKARPGYGQHTKPSRKLSRRRAQNALNLLRVCLGAAVERGLIATNPAEGVRLPRAMGLTHEPWTYLLPDEQARLLGCDAIPEEDRLLYAFAIGTGMRESELWNLHLADVQLEERVVVVRFGGHGKATKGKRIRRVPLFGLALEALERWLPMLTSRPNPLGLAWPLRGGERRWDGKAPRHLREHLAAASLEPAGRHDKRAVRFHDFRHTCASSLVAGWWGRRWSLEEVGALLGHRSITTTQRYAHLGESALRSAAAATDLTAMSPRPSGPIAANTEKHRAPPTRLERMTFGLGKRSIPETLHEVTCAHGETVGTSAADVGRRILAAIAAGGPGAWRVVTECAGELLKGAQDELAAPAQPQRGRR